MNANEYQKLAARTLLSTLDFQLNAYEVAILANAIGLAGEAGEVAEVAKKAVLHQHGIDVEKFKKELGDVLWYVAGLATTLGLDLGEIMEANIEKLRLRYPEGWSAERSINRDVRREDESIGGRRECVNAGSGKGRP